MLILQKMKYNSWEKKIVNLSSNCLNLKIHSNKKYRNAEKDMLPKMKGCSINIKNSSASS